jgi:hypothetical protein
MAEGKGSAPRSLLGYELETADYLFAGAMLVVLLLNFNMLSELKQLPSPIYGGDLYNGLGGVNHIMSGGSLFASAQLVGEIPWVPWLYHVLVSLYATVTGADALTGIIWFSFPATIAAGIICYLFVCRMTGNKYLALSGTILLLRAFPLFKYSEFAACVMVPAFLLMLYEFIKNQNVRNAALAGILLGLAGLSNTQAFFVAFGIFFLAAAAFELPKLWREKKFAIDAGAQETIKLYGVVFAIGFAISLLFWFWPIFVFHGNTPNPIQDITTPDVKNPTYVWDTIINYSLKPLFLPYGGGIEIVFTLLCLAGVAYALLERRNDGAKFTLVLVAAALLATFHTLVTEPLLGKHLVNFMLVTQIQPLLQATLIPMGLLLLFRKVTKEKGRLILAGALLLLSLSLYFGDFEARKTNQWYATGTRELAQPFVELQSWIKANTSVNDVFLTTNEDAFMMNALTGRKSVSYRRAHSSPYTDMNRRMADQAVIVYGTDSAEADALLKKYDVKYLLWSSQWITDEFSFDQQGQLAGFFDPLDIPDNATERAYWDAHGVKYLNQTISLDPAPRAGAPTYPVLIAIPYKLDIQSPYNPRLLDGFVLKKTIQSNGQDVFRIYERKGAN